ncbi:MAG TPA: hypothetical protein VGH60_05845 [Solirubrobacteraceae bacterium]
MPGTRSSIAWHPATNLNDRDWITIGRKLGAISRCSQWWIGDWVRYGSARWGERYTLAARVTGYDARTLRNMAWIASCFTSEQRRHDLTWSHHASVAPLDPAEQDYWLTRCAAERLSVTDLRVELRAALRARDNSASTIQTASPITIVCPRCGQTIDAR